MVTLTPINVYAGAYFATTAEATQKATELGYVKIHERSNGQPIYKATKSAKVKGLPYITPDIDSHSSGAWKSATSVEKLSSKNTRVGTYDVNLNRLEIRIMNKIIEWEDRTKTISQLIEELKSFEDQELIVMVTSDEGHTFNSVKLVSKGFKTKDDGDEAVYCALHI